MGGNAKAKLQAEFWTSQPKSVLEAEDPVWVFASQGMRLWGLRIWILVLTSLGVDTEGLAVLRQLSQAVGQTSIRS